VRSDRPEIWPLNRPGSLETSNPGQAARVPSTARRRNPTGFAVGTQSSSARTNSRLRSSVRDAGSRFLWAAHEPLPPGQETHRHHRTALRWLLPAHAPAHHDPAALPHKISEGYGSISRTVFPAVLVVGFGGREPVAEGDGEGVDRGLPSHRPPDLAGPGGVEGPGDQVEAL
jgi:hypothetical protein